MLVNVFTVRVVGSGMGVADRTLDILYTSMCCWSPESATSHMGAFSPTSCSAVGRKFALLLTSFLKRLTPRVRVGGILLTSTLILADTTWTWVKFPPESNML